MRLPVGLLRPHHYALTLLVHLTESSTFSGHLRMKAELLRPTQTLTLHAVDLALSSSDVSLLPLSTKAVHSPFLCSQHSSDRERQTVSFDFNQQLQPGLYELNVKYTGQYSDALRGLYRATYTALDGTRKSICVTQFEATDARRALPCVDEPHAKATFDVTLITPPHVVARSNTHAVSVNTVAQGSNGSDERWPGLIFDKGFVEHRFARTPVMSTYLLAVLVGELDYISAFTEKQVEVRIYTQPGNAHLGQFALHVAQQSLQIFGDYFGVHDLLKKVDHVAIPDFAAGAMENWGLVTYRDTALLWDPLNSSAAMKLRVARVVAHETSHFWFGNRVTFQWWDNLWLNEGFARFSEHLAVDRILPEWHVWETFVSDVFNLAMNMDSLLSTHAIQQSCETEAEIDQMFSPISYAKGASTIRMLRSFIGEKAFQAGMRNYMQRYAFQNTQADDLWNALADTSGANLQSIMNKWISMEGFPFVHVKRHSSNAQKLVLLQHRFLASGENASGNDVWPIPLTFMSLASGGTNRQECMIFDCSSMELDVTGFSSPIKFNIDTVGFYRVLYEQNLWEELLITLPCMTVLDRIGFVTDTMAFCSAGRMPIDCALRLAQSLKEEQSYAVLNGLADGLNALSARHNEEEYHPHLQALIRDVFRPTFHRLGLVKSDPNEIYTQIMLRNLAVSILASADDEEVVSKLLGLFDETMSGDHNVLPADLRASAYKVAMKKRGAEAQQQLLHLYKKSPLAEERVRILSCLAEADNNSPEVQAIVDAGLAFTLDSSRQVRTQDFVYAFGSLASTRIGREHMWKWLQANLSMLHELLKGSLLSGSIGAIVSGFRTLSDAEAIEAFFAAHHIPEVTMKVRQSVETVRNKASRIAREREPIRRFFQLHQH